MPIPAARSATTSRRIISALAFLLKRWDLIVLLVVTALAVALVVARWIGRVRMAREDAVTWRLICAGRDLEKKAFIDGRRVDPPRSGENRL